MNFFLFLLIVFSLFNNKNGKIYIYSNIYFSFELETVIWSQVFYVEGIWNFFLASDLSRTHIARFFQRTNRISFSWFVLSKWIRCLLICGMIFFLIVKLFVNCSSVLFGFLCLWCGRIVFRMFCFILSIILLWRRSTVT